MASNRADFSNYQAMNKEAREAITNAFDALSEWRDDMAGANNRYSSKVFDQMTEASRAMGWPDSLVSATRDHLSQASKMQLEMMDKVMDAWQDQLKSPNFKPSAPPTNAPSGMPGGMPTNPMEMMQQFYGAMMPGGAQGGLGGMPMAPFHFWMQTAEMWQKNWASAMSLWMNGPAGLSDMMEQMQNQMQGKPPKGK